MALRTRCITAQKLPEDGLRILVMSSQMLVNGKMYDSEIQSGMFDEWWRVLAPPPKLAWHYYKNNLPWDEFAGQYTGYLASRHVQAALRRLIWYAHQGDATILCVEGMPTHCHRRLIAEACLWLDPLLDVLIE